MITDAGWVREKKGLAKVCHNIVSISSHDARISPVLKVTLHFTQNILSALEIYLIELSSNIAGEMYHIFLDV